MYRTKKTNIKIGLAIIVFFLSIVTIFIGITFYFNSLSNKTLSKNQLYVLSVDEYNKTLENNGIFNLDMNNLISENYYQTQYSKSFLSTLMFLSVTFIVLLFILLIGLWIILNSFRKKELKQIINHLDVVLEDNFSNDDPVLKMAYEKLKSKFDDRLNDYKRLNAYLSHDQKNTLAVLRTEIELSNNINTLKNLDNLSDSIDNILTLSENINQNSLFSVDVALVCAEVCDNYKKIFSNITFEFEENTNTVILARERWIYRAVSNILDNAIKYGNNKPIRVIVKEKKGSIIIIIEDNGIGISDNEQKKIFNDRYRVNELNKKGYGLGLSLVSHVCDLCGGFIAVDSTINKGTKFYLAFPKLD